VSEARRLARELRADYELLAGPGSEGLDSPFRLMADAAAELERQADEIDEMTGAGISSFEPRRDTPEVHAMAAHHAIVHDDPERARAHLRLALLGLARQT
jgi:hypothetical protein